MGSMRHSYARRDPLQGFATRTALRPRLGQAEVHSDLDDVMKMMRAGQVHAGMDTLIQSLRERRLRSTPAEWERFMSQEALPHPIRHFVHQDPFTRRAFLKPRGFPGDAVLLDYIYGVGAETTPPQTEIGAEIYRYTFAGPASRAVRFRRSLLADLIDGTADRIPSCRVLSLACGHLREAQLSSALQDGRVGSFVALDHDALSLEVIRREYGDLGISILNRSIRDVIAGRLDFRDFDLVYASGLFDYLSQRASQRLAALMFDALRPGGSLLLTNFLPNVHDVGYMECFMAWQLVTRTDEEMVDIVAAIPRELIADVTLSHDPDENIVFLKVLKRGDGAASSTASSELT